MSVINNSFSNRVHSLPNGGNCRDPSVSKQKRYEYIFIFLYFLTLNKNVKNLLETENIMIMLGYKYHRYVAGKEESAKSIISSSIFLFLYNSVELTLQMSIILLVGYSFQAQGKPADILVKFSIVY